MKTKFLRNHTVLALFLLLFATSSLLSNSSNFNIQNPTYNPSASADFITDNIIIDGNDELEDFCAENGTGDGLSWSSAYRIENYSIDTNRSGTGFELRNTDKYVILKNLTIKNSGFLVNDVDSGIKIENCSNIRVINCSVYSNFYGFALKDSKNIRISDSFAGDNNSIGIYLQNSDSNEISENLILNNSLHGVYILNSDLNNISNNNILNNSDSIIYIPGSESNATNIGSGIFLSSANNNSIQNNDIYFNKIGLSLKFSSNNVINNNIFLNNTICIKIFESTDNIITDNDDCEVIEVPLVPIIPGYPSILIAIFMVPSVLILLIKVKKKLVK